MTPAVLTVDLEALAANFRTLGRVSGAEVHPVVKADAYGLGAAACAQRLMREGAQAFFVARVAGGERLRRELGPGPIIWVLDGCPPGAAGALKASDLRPVLNEADQLAEWRAVGGGACALHIDTGMNRLGFRPEDAPEPFPGIELVMSHLACSDEPSHPMNGAQREAFAAVCRSYPGAKRSLSNSGGCFLGEGYGLDVVRPGICLYGGGPEGRPDARILPVATFTAPVLQLRDVPPGESVGYGGGFVVSRPTRVAVAGAGYADGVLRSFSPAGQVFVGGQLRPIVGRVSMDLLAVDVTGLDVAVGAPIELFGPNRMLDDAARDAGTVSWELLTAVGERVERTYVGG